MLTNCTAGYPHDYDIQGEYILVAGIASKQYQTPMLISTRVHGLDPCHHERQGNP